MTIKRHLTAIVLFICVFAFYLYTLAPSVVWGDGVKFQMEVALGGSSYLFFEEADPIPTDGLPFARLGVAAWDHPLYVMLGQSFLAVPWGDMAFRVNLISAWAGALTIALIYQVGLYLVHNRWAAILGALVLAVSHTFWWHAVTAESYTLHAVFMVSLIGLTVRWSRDRRWHTLAWFALLAGLGLANHLMLVLTLVPLIGFMLMVALVDDGHGFRTRLVLDRSRRLIRSAVSGRGLVCFSLFVIGLAPWWIQFIRMAHLIGLPLTSQLAAGYPWLPRDFIGSSIGALIINLLIYTAWLLYQFTPLGVALGVYGFVLMRRSQPRLARLLAALWLIHLMFSANYLVWNRFAFHLPSYLIFALFIINGLAGSIQKLNMRLGRRTPWVRHGAQGLALGALVLAPIGIYAVVPPALHAVGLTDQRVGIPLIGIGVRDGLTTFLDPNQRADDSATRFGRSTLEQLTPNAFVFTANNVDGEAYLVLRYFQLVEHLRPDVHFELMLFRTTDAIPRDVLALARAQSACRPIYLASLNPDAYPLAQLQTEFEIVPEANIFRLVPLKPRPGASSCPGLDHGWANISLEQRIREAMQWR